LQLISPYLLLPVRAGGLSKAMASASRGAATASGPASTSGSAEIPAVAPPQQHSSLDRPDFKTVDFVNQIFPTGELLCLPGLPSELYWCTEKRELSAAGAGTSGSCLRSGAGLGCSGGSRWAIRTPVALRGIRRSVVQRDNGKLAPANAMILLFPAPVPIQRSPSPGLTPCFRRFATESDESMRRSSKLSGSRCGDPRHALARLGVPKKLIGPDPRDLTARQPLSSATWELCARFL